MTEATHTPATPVPSCVIVIAVTAEVARRTSACACRPARIHTSAEAMITNAAESGHLMRRQHQRRGSPLVIAAARLWATLFYGHVHRMEDRDAVVKGDTLLGVLLPRVAVGLRAAFGSTMVGRSRRGCANGTRATSGQPGNCARRRERRELPVGRARVW